MSGIPPKLHSLPLPTAVVAVAELSPSERKWEDRLDNLLEDARKAVDAGHYDEAVKMYTMATKMELAVNGRASRVIAARRLHHMPGHVGSQKTRSLPRIDGRTSTSKHAFNLLGSFSEANLARQTQFAHTQGRQTKLAWDSQTLIAKTVPLKGRFDSQMHNYGKVRPQQNRARRVSSGFPRVLVRPILLHSFA
jgi:hypothetical protein